jgi:hypothetical protein
MNENRPGVIVRVSIFRISYWLAFVTKCVSRVKQMTPVTGKEQRWGLNFPKDEPLEISTISSHDSIVDGEDQLDSTGSANTSERRGHWSDCFWLAATRMSWMAPFLL